MQEITEDLVDIEIVQLTAFPDFTIEVEFNDGRSGRIDLKDYVGIGPAFDSLCDPSYFCLAEIDEFGTICWPEGPDIAIERLIERLPKVQAMIGNKNAQQEDEPKSETLVVRITPTLQKELKDKAMAENMSISAFVTREISK